VRIYLLGQNHRTAPVELRERLALTSDKQARLGDLLTDTGLVREGAVLSTCNRMELYAVGDLDGTARRELGQVLQQLHGVDLQRWQESLYFLEERQAIRHLFHVASGLDSMVLGEGQIISQVREAGDWAQERKLAGDVLRRVFQDAVACGKRVRSDTGLGEGAVSVAYAAVSLARKIFKDLSKETVLLLGAGDTGHRVARHFKLFGVKDLRVANRTADRAVALAKEMDASMVPWTGLEEQLRQSSIVVCATASPEPILHASQIRRALKESGRRATFLIDLAVPRDIDPAVGEIAGVFLYNVDDLQKVVLDGEEHRREEATKAEQIVEEQLDRFLDWYRGRRLAPTIHDLQERVSDLWRQESPHLQAHLDEAEFAEVDRTVRRVLKRVLHPPIVGAKEWIREEDPDAATRRFRALFGLGDPPDDA